MPTKGAALCALVACSYLLKSTMGRFAHLRSLGATWVTVCVGQWNPKYGCRGNG